MIDRYGWVILGLCGLGAGCASTEPASPPPQSAGLNALAEEETLAAERAQDPSLVEGATPTDEPVSASLADQIAMQAQRSIEVASLLDAPIEREPAKSSELEDLLNETEVDLGAELDQDLEEDLGDELAGVLAAGTPEPAAEEPSREEMVDRLVALLADEAAGSADPYAALLGVAAMEAVEPGALEELRQRDPQAFDLLFDEQGEMLESARKLIAAFASGERDEVSSLAREVAGELGGEPTLVVSTLELCTRVDGFGRYTPFGSTRFVAGRGQPVIVYTELEGFTHAPEALPNGGSGGVDGFAVEVSQEVEIRHAADDLLAWRRSSGRVRDVSRNRVRDFYLVNEIELPATLTVGRYTLKVITRDRNREGSVAEAAIQIEIVADPSLVSADR